MSLIDNINSAANQIYAMQAVTAANSAHSANQALIQRDWQVQQNAKAMEFNRVEAEKNRNWQKMMSDTAHQREIADLRAAGLNPVLSAMGGNGASVTSGATASGVTSSGAKGDVDMSLNSALVSLLSSVYNRTTQLEAANINARTQEAIADKQAATSQIVANIAAGATKYAADKTDARSYIELGKEYFPVIKQALQGDNPVSSAVDKAKNWWQSTDDHYDDYKKYGADDMSFGDLTSALVGSIKNLFK